MSWLQRESWLPRAAIETVSTNWRRSIEVGHILSALVDQDILSSQYALRFPHSSLTHFLTHYRKNVGAPVGRNGLKWARICWNTVHSMLFPLINPRNFSRDTLITRRPSVQIRPPQPYLPNGIDAPEKTQAHQPFPGFLSSDFFVGKHRCKMLW